MITEETKKYAVMVAKRMFDKTACTLAEEFGTAQYEPFDFLVVDEDNYFRFVVLAIAEGDFVNWHEFIKENYLLSKLEETAHNYFANHLDVDECSYTFDLFAVHFISSERVLVTWAHDMQNDQAA